MELGSPSGVFAGRLGGLCAPGQLQEPPLGHRGRDGEELHRCLKAWTWPEGSLGEGSGALQGRTPSLLAWPQLSSPTGQRLGELEGPREKARICLLPHLHLRTSIRKQLAD